MENEHGPCALADDEVALPMTSLGSSVDIFRPFMDGDAILYGIPRLRRESEDPLAKRRDPDLPNG